MSEEHEKTNTASQVSEGIDPQAAPFEPGYQPGSLPQIHVPDLADDAQGLSAEALANVPTLTESVPPAPETAESDAVVQPQDDVDVVDVPPHEPAEPEVPAQAEPIQADTWGEQLHARMGKLTDDINILNARLDRLEERNKTKV